MKKVGIIEIGSTNTKTHVYENKSVVFEASSTIEFKKNYNVSGKIIDEDLEKLYLVIEAALENSDEVHLFGCSIFRSIDTMELSDINNVLEDKFGLLINVISQEDEASLTALGCYNSLDYKGNTCIFIGGGGSTELVIVNDKKVVKEFHFDFGVVDITKKFSSLKDDVPSVTFDEVQDYIESLIGDIDITCDLLILAGGDHLYWYNNARYDLIKNDLYEIDNQKYMLTREMSDGYDRDALITSLDNIRKNSDNPLWFDGSRAMKVITNTVSKKVNAKYIVPTKINMEEGLVEKLMS